MKACSSCGKEAFDGASKCPFCDKPFENKKVRWYFRTSSLIVGFLVVGPFILPAVWVNPHYSARKKWLVTATILFFTYLLTAAFVKAIGYIVKYYGLILNP